MNISIVTVTLNDLEGLKKTASSLMKQTEKSFEWVIKDGGSMDGTTDFVHELKFENSINIIYKVEKDVSVYDAMNQSLLYVTGNYVLFLNAGDYLASYEVLEKCNAIIDENPFVSFIYGDNFDLTAGGIMILKKARKLNYLKNSLPTSHQAIFYNRKLLTKYSYPLQFSVCGDYALTAQIFFDGNSDFIYLDFPISVFTLGGLSQQNRRILLWEGLRIHKDIAGNNSFISYIKYLKRGLIFLMLDYFPIGYKVIRNINDALRVK